MRNAWRIVAGGLCGVTGVVVWAVSLAVYQQLMEPTGFFTDPETGQAHPNLAANNTYWPREIRQMAILLAFAGVAVVCRAATRGLAAGAVGSVVWLGADLWLDRVDIDGRTVAYWLAAAGIVGFAATAGVAAWLSRGRLDTARYFLAGALSVPAALILSISTPWDEPVVEPNQVRIENALTVFQVGLIAMFLVATIALVAEGLTRANALWVVALLAVTVVLVGLGIGSNGQGGLWQVLPYVPWLLAVTAARAIPRTVVMAVGGAGVLMVAVVFIVLLFGGMIAGPILTSIAGNPEVNGADTDFSVALPGLLAGVLVAYAARFAIGAVGQEPGGHGAVPAVAEP